MAFFGLTHLGPQSFFRENGLDNEFLLNFTDEQVYEAFDLVDRGGAGTIGWDETRLVLAELYHSQPPETEVKQMLRILDRNCQATTEAAAKRIAVTRDQFLEGVHVLQEMQREQKIDAVAAPAREFTSNQAFRNNMHKHTRLQHDPQRKFRAPMTTSQQYGWYTQNTVEQVVRRPNNSCEETRYASEMIKSGIYF